MSATKPTKEQKENDENLKKNLDAVFKYARMFVVNKSEDEESELMAIIQLKKQILERLFPTTTK